MAVTGKGKRAFVKARIADQLIAALKQQYQQDHHHPRSENWVVFHCKVDTGSKYFVAKAAPDSDCLRKGRTIGNSIPLDPKVLLRRLTTC
jgi:hypothetical protein